MQYIAEVDEVARSSEATLHTVREASESREESSLPHILATVTALSERVLAMEGKARNGLSMYTLPKEPPPSKNAVEVSCCYACSTSPPVSYPPTCTNLLCFRL